MSYNKCPFATQQARAVTDNDHFFPNTVKLQILNQEGQNDPMKDKSFNYAEEFISLDLKEVKHDIQTVLSVSQPWWPADWGNYGPFMIRMAWHVAGTYRAFDGRGGANRGNQRFAPLNSWPDNANLDTARRLLWPVKQKYGKKLSWADLFMLTGNVAYEMAGLKTFGFGGGREDIYSPEIDTYWGPETGMLTDERHEAVGKIKDPMGASEMGLIYVNPEGPGGNPDPLEAAKEIRATFRNMNMNDEETVALIAGGHTVGKSHGAAPADRQGPLPENAPIEQQGLGYKSDYKSGMAEDTVTSGLEGAWTYKPLEWDNNYWENLFEYEWECVKGPGGKYQWTPKIDEEKLPDAHVADKYHKPMMFTTDIALKEDPTYGPIAKHFYENPKEFQETFAKAWFKLLHRDMGPVNRLLGSEVPPPQLFQDPIPPLDHPVIDESDIDFLKTEILGKQKGGVVSKLLHGTNKTPKDVPTPTQFIKVAWASACTFRQTDYRGGANGARIRFMPQRQWEANDPEELTKVLEYLETIHSKFNDDLDNLKTNKRVSMADLIVLAGCAGVEAAAEEAGHKNVRVPFTPGRMDAIEEMTDVDSFQYLEPKADGFRNYYNEKRSSTRPEELLVDMAHKLSLTAPEMTVLVGGMRALGATSGDSKVGVLTNKPGRLTNDFFLNLLSMDYEWEPLESKSGDDTNTLYHGKVRSTGQVKWMASRADLIFGHQSDLRAVAEFYACDDSAEDFVRDFVAAFSKVMELDRYDLHRPAGSKRKYHLSSD